MVAGTSSDSSDDGARPSSYFPFQAKLPCKPHLIVGGLLVWSLLVGLWCFWESWQLWRCIAAWERVPPRSVLQSDRCPCSCAQGSNDDVHMRREFEFCAEGDACFFGKQWCARSVPSWASAATNPVLGRCQKDRCGGPRGVESFNISCDRSADPPFHVSWLVRNFPAKVRRMLRFGAGGLNHHLNSPGGAMDRNGLQGVSLTVSEDLIDSLNARLDRLSVVWHIGCWPPARYLVASGQMTIDSGWVRLAAAGITLQVDLANVLVTIKNMRVEIACPQGIFTLDGFGDGAQTSKPLTAASFAVEQQTRTSGVQCRGGWGLFCWVTRRLAQAEIVREALPAVLVYIVLSFSGLDIAPGCDVSRNSFTLLPYEDKDCCEETYLTDHTGCLVGGQFNGRFVPGQTWAEGVDCKYNEDIMAFQANCASIPGSYTEKSPGICTEAGLPWRAARTPGFDGQKLRADISAAVQRLLRGELAIVAAVLAPFVAAVIYAATALQDSQRREWHRISG
ncbi:unnamed protein product [Symbiodinium natans]|uniref:Uncharacterized protein n=1 Tax=Symbiodinium natans TaxID=878477 RepID=A0A812I5J4_9DINO|nr:unnamed protein product [Symbiodinium natans]